MSLYDDANLFVFTQMCRKHLEIDDIKKFSWNLSRMSLTSDDRRSEYLNILLDIENYKSALVISTLTFCREGELCNSNNFTKACYNVCRLLSNAKYFFSIRLIREGPATHLFFCVCKVSRFLLFFFCLQGHNRERAREWWTNRIWQ